MNLANKITITRIALIPLFLFVFQLYPAWAVAIFILASATDKLDGYVARKYNQVTNLGKLLDPLADKLLISVALILMVQHHLIPSWIAVVIIGREVFISAIRIAASARGIALAADQYGKWKMVLQVVGITAVLLHNYPFQYVTTFPIDVLLLYAAVALTIYSGYNYLKNNYKRLQLEL